MSEKIKRSATASPDQPVATKPLHRFTGYQTAGGRRALAMQIDIRSLAAFYAEHPDRAGAYEANWHSGGQASPYLPRRVNDAADALAILDAFEFPSEIKTAAMRASRRLVRVFDDAARLRVQHDLTSGRLDLRKLPAIARTTAAGTYDPNLVRPYKRTQPAPAVRPTVAVVASSGNRQMWGDARYIPRILTLTLGIVWACQAAGLDAHAALMQSRQAMRSRAYDEAIAGIMLAEPGTTISPRTYGVALHRDLWRHGLMTARAADPPGLDHMMVLQGEKQSDPADIRRAWPCAHGGDAAHWARAILGADIVIAIGVITDARAGADIHLADSFDLDTAVDAIVRQAHKLERTA